MPGWSVEVARQRASLSDLAAVEAEARRRLNSAFIAGRDDEAQRLGYLLARIAQVRTTVLLALAAVEERAQAEGEES